MQCYSWRLLRRGPAAPSLMHQPALHIPVPVTGTGATDWEHLTTITDPFFLNCVLSLDKGWNGTQTNTQGVWSCKLLTDSLPLQQLARSPTLMVHQRKLPC